MFYYNDCICLLNRTKYSRKQGGENGVWLLSEVCFEELAICLLLK